MSSSADLPLFRFGIVADPQYAAIEPHAGMNRCYARSLGKLAEAVEVFNGQDLSFVMTLGDVIDGRFESFDDILPVYGKLRHECLFLLGNHDFAVSAAHLPAVAGKLSMPAPHYSFSRHGFRFIVLDGNEVSTFAPPEGHPFRVLAAERLAALKEAGAINAQSWNGSLGDAQFAWLGEEIDKAAAAGETVIVMNHYPVFPPNEHDLWDRERVIALLSGQGHVAAYLCGHNHAGNYGRVGACHFVNFKGMVDTESENTFAIVDVHADRLEIRGFGREESRTLSLQVPALP